VPRINELVEGSPGERPELRLSLLLTVGQGAHEQVGLRSLAE
jgi:hypothetical protein